MKKIKIYLGILMLVLFIVLSSNVNAAGSVTLSASKSTVTVGDEFSITVSLNGASAATLTTRISIDTSKVEYISGPSNSSYSNGRVIYTWTDPTGGSNPKTGALATFKFKSKQAGKASFSVNGDLYDSDENPINPSFSGTSVTIQEKVVTPPPETGGNTGGNTGGSTGGGSSGGTTTPPPPTTSTKPNTGGNSNSGNTNTNNTSTNANLKSLHINIEGMSPSFNKNTTKYYITVPNTISSLQVTAEPEDKGAKVNITGNTDLKTGDNKITIEVTAADNKTKKTYTINATKTDDPNTANANLENLAIENVILDPEFNADITQYTTTIASNHETLNILAVPQIEGATVNIQGKDNIQFGQNQITITVTATNGTTTKDYIISLYKKTEEEELQEQQQIMPINEEEPPQETKQTIKAGHVAIITITVLGVGGIIFILIRKYILENR